MKKVTDLEAVKNIARCLAHLEIGETEFSPIVVQHPIFDSGIVWVEGRENLVNILEDKEGYKKAMEQLEKRISHCDDLVSVYSIFRTAYKLTFIKFVMDELSIDDMSLLLADAWVTEENPNQDANVNTTMATRWFKKANKRVLMTEEDYAVYEALEPEFKVYRGVAVGRNPKGLSWTKSYEKAKWFANRFNTGGKVGYIQEATLKKENVLAYFNTRDEDEIVANIKDMTDIKRLDSE